MKDLLTKLQAYPKTWERFVDYITPDHDYTYDPNLEWFIENETKHFMPIHLLNGLLTSFCDGEGYYVTPEKKYRNWITSIWDKEGFEIPTFLPIKPSRQEAFDQGVEKSFELMENKLNGELK